MTCGAGVLCGEEWHHALLVWLWAFECDALFPIPVTCNQLVKGMVLLLGCWTAVQQFWVQQFWLKVSILHTMCRLCTIDCFSQN